MEHLRQNPPVLPSLVRSVIVFRFSIKRMQSRQIPTLYSTTRTKRNFHYLQQAAPIVVSKNDFPTNRFQCPFCEAILPLGFVVACNAVPLLHHSEVYLLRLTNQRCHPHCHWSSIPLLPSPLVADETPK